MKHLTKITDDPKQSFRVQFDTGEVLTLYLEYKKNLKGWYYTAELNDVTFYTRRVVRSPNMLRQFKNIITYGIACTTSDGLEPIFVDDFSSGRANIYILSAADVALVESEIISVEVST